jgi:hypothetical protein
MRSFRLLFLLCFLSSFALAGVTVSKPSDGSNVSSPVNFVASATTSCSKGVASMGIYTAPYKLAYVTNGDHLDTDLNLSPGTYNTVVVAWNYCGGADTKPVKITVKSGTGVYVTSPSNNSQVTSPVHYVATATTSCPKGVAAMGIYTAPYQKAYVTPGAKLDTNLSLSPGTYNTTVVEWDNCGGADTAPVKITVTGSGGGGNMFANLQASKGWQGYGELPPKYDICSDCSPEVTWAMYQHISSPSISGDATKYDLGGTTPYADALWNNHLIGDGSSQGMLDSDHKIVPNLHSFIYDVYFYGTHLELSEAIEFDVAQFFDGMGFMFGTECKTVDGQQWAIWDNVDSKWDETGIPCHPQNNTWNHLVLEVERTNDNQLHYKSVTLNGDKKYFNNAYYHPFSAPGWYGIVVNFQLDGNYKQAPYTVYLDKFSLTYK